MDVDWLEYMGQADDRPQTVEVNETDTSVEESGLKLTVIDPPHKNSADTIFSDGDDKQAA